MKIKLPMPRKPNYWEIVATWTILTVVGGFAGQYWYYSYTNASSWLSDAPPVADTAAQLERTQRAKLEGGSLPIEAAMERIAAADRGTIPSIRPEESRDMAPAAGWMHHPSYVAPPAFVEPETPEPSPELDAVEDLEGAEATADEAPTAAPAPAPAPAAAPAATNPVRAAVRVQRPAPAQPAPAAMQAAPAAPAPAPAE